jgi:hypothetical protein
MAQLSPRLGKADWLDGEFSAGGLAARVRRATGGQCAAGEVS